MTYVAQFLHRYPEPRGAEETVPTIQGEFQKLAAWLSETTARLQRLIDTGSLPTDYSVRAGAVATSKQHVKLSSFVYTRLSPFLGVPRIPRGAAHPCRVV